MNYKYGIPVDQLENLILKPRPIIQKGGLKIVIYQGKKYNFEQVEVWAGSSVSLTSTKDFESTIFVEEGRLNVQGTILSRHQVFSLSPGNTAYLQTHEKSVLYLFEGPPKNKRSVAEFRKTFDQRDKYWGRIETIVNEEYTGKRLFFRKGQHSSLHFHCQKHETYYIHSGLLLVRLRAGRGEDRFFKLEPGMTLTVPPGLMHQDGGLEDTVIIEASTHDEDNDSFIVEDGQKHRMPQF